MELVNVDTEDLGAAFEALRTRQVPHQAVRKTMAALSGLLGREVADVEMVSVPYILECERDLASPWAYHQLLAHTVPHQDELPFSVREFFPLRVTNTLACLRQLWWMNLRSCAAGYRQACREGRVNLARQLASLLELMGQAPPLGIRKSSGLWLIMLPS